MTQFTSRVLFISTAVMMFVVLIYVSIDAIDALRFIQTTANEKQYSESMRTQARLLLDPLV